MWRAVDIRCQTSMCPLKRVEGGGSSLLTWRRGIVSGPRFEKIIVAR